MATHPDPVELTAYLANALSDEDDARIQAHLEAGCPECERTIELAERSLDPGFVVPPSGLVRRVRGLGRAAPPAGPPPLVPGYEIERELGRGGMAVVYLARDRSGRRVALKLIPNAAYANPELAARFEREGELALAASDQARELPESERPALAEVYAAGRTDDVLFIAMEYAAGGTLRDRLADLAREPREAARLLAGAASAVAWLHALRPPVYHRDCKPSNFLLAPRTDAAPHGAGAIPLTSLGVRVADLGLAYREGDPQLTRTGELIGTDLYLAPELLRAGPADPARAEVYALGATLYELLHGTPPFLAATPAGLLRAIQDGHPSRPGRAESPVPRALQAVCLKCLERDPARRYPGAQELADDLNRYLAGEPVRATLAGPARRLARWGRKNPGVLALVAGLTLTTLALTGLTGWALERADAAGRAATEAQARGALEAERRAAADARAAALGERYGLLLRLGVAQGDGREVLTVFAQAKDDGLPITPEMRLDYVRGLAGTFETDAVRAEVDAVPLDGLGPATRGRYELWRATTRFGDDDAAAEAYLRDALTRPLPPADREFAEGLVASTTPLAVDHFRAAIRHDRLHQPARSEACLLLMMLGRLDEAISLADESASALPRHPDFPVIEGLAHAFKGDEARAGAALARLDGLLPADEVELLRKIPPLLAAGVRYMRGRVGYGPKPGLLDEFTLMRRAVELSARRPLARPDTAGRLLGHLPPGLRSRHGVYFGLVREFSAKGVGVAATLRIANVEYRLAESAAHPEGFVLLLLASECFDRHNEATDPAERVRWLRLAATTAERAADTPGLVPVRDIALDLAFMFHTRAGSQKASGPLADPASAHRAAVLLRRRLATYGELPPDHCYVAARAALIAGDLALAREVLDSWERRAPAEPATHRQRAELEFRTGAYRPALAALGRALDRAPFDIGLHLTRLITWARLLDTARMGG